MKNGLYLLVLLFLTACTNDNKQNSQQQEDTVKVEPTYWDSIQEFNPQKMNLVIDGKKMELVYFKQNEDLVYKALEIEKSDKPLHYKKMNFYDFTNDGIKDTAIYETIMQGDSAILCINSIILNKKVVWTDSMTIDSSGLLSYAQEAWSNDSAYYKLFPYSAMVRVYPSDTFFTKHLYVDANKWRVTNIDERQTHFANHVEAYHNELTDKEKSELVTNIDVYFLKYNGKYVKALTYDLGADASIYGWYPADSTFIPISIP